MPGPSTGTITWRVGRWASWYSRDTQMRELHSRVFIADLPLEQMVPHWLGGVIKPMLTSARPVGNGHVRLARYRPVGSRGRLYVEHAIGGHQRRGDGRRNRRRREPFEAGRQIGRRVARERSALANNSLVGDGLSPQGYLPNLYQGQTWSVCNYSLFHPATNPIEIIEARVEQHEPIVWNGESVKAWVVVYRGDAGAGMASEPRAKVWVRDDGRDKDGLVLQQELWLFGSKLRFTRLTSERCRTLRDAIDQYAMEEIPARREQETAAVDRPIADIGRREYRGLSLPGKTEGSL